MLGIFRCCVFSGSLILFGVLISTYKHITTVTTFVHTQSARAVEYSDYISAGG